MPPELPSPHSGPDAPSADVVAQAEFYKRKADALEDRCRTLESSNTAKKKKLSATKPGRGIRKVIDMFHELPELVSKSHKHEAANTLSTTEMEEIDAIDFLGMSSESVEEERKDRQRCHTALHLLTKLIPNFNSRINSEDHAVVDLYLRSLQEGANDARSDDLGKLKIAMANWLNSRSPHPSKPFNVTIRADRGIGNDITGRLLCPINYEWDNLETRANLRNCATDYDMVSTFFFHCLYLNEKGDAKSPKKGFLKGPLLVRVFKFIFTSPLSAKDENDPPQPNAARRQNIATKLRMDGQVTARSIAYAAVQLVFNLQSAKEWCLEHAGIHYPSFYNFILGFFEDAQTNSHKTFVSSLLKWWSIQIFPQASVTSRQANNAASASQRMLDEEEDAESGAS